MAEFSSLDKVARLTPLREASSSSDQPRSPRKSFKRCEIRRSIEISSDGVISIYENFSQMREFVKGRDSGFLDLSKLRM
jgi:hypothetical protein